MGDVADAALDGTLCQICGVFIGEPVGHPRTCPGCKEMGDAPDYEYEREEKSDG